jgi:hypothetical protein
MSVGSPQPSPIAVSIYAWLPEDRTRGAASLSLLRSQSARRSGNANTSTAGLSATVSEVDRSRRRWRMVRVCVSLLDVSMVKISLPAIQETLLQQRLVGC